jgi:hypothetical protein
LDSLVTVCGETRGAAGASDHHCGDIHDMKTAGANFCRFAAASFGNIMMKPMFA